MNRKQQVRLLVATSVITCVSLVAFFVIEALHDQINLFLTPTELVYGKVKPGARIRIGGMVREGTVNRSSSLEVAFVITDFKHDLRVEYKGVLPDLFKEKQGVVVSGVWRNPSCFIAEEVLAKHDENYMPLVGLNHDS